MVTNVLKVDIVSVLYRLRERILNDFLNVSTIKDKTVLMAARFEIQVIQKLDHCRIYSRETDKRIFQIL